MVSLMKYEVTTEDVTTTTYLVEADSPSKATQLFLDSDGQGEYPVISTTNDLYILKVERSE